MELKGQEKVRKKIKSNTKKKKKIENRGEGTKKEQIVYNLD